MNDPQVLEAGRVLAYKAMEGQISDAHKVISFMFRAATSRVPDESDLIALVDYFDQEKARLVQDKEAVEGILRQGEYPHPERLDPVISAAYALTANVILNLDEFVYKG